MERIGAETMVLYADTRERLEVFEAMRSIASLPGEFTTKTTKGSVYHYFQTILPGGRTQIYIGPDNEQTRQLIRVREIGKEHALADKKMFQRLAAQIMAGGVVPILPDVARIITRLADSGLFGVGGVLVGTIAYRILGPHLGITWSDSSMTHDLAGDNRVAVAVPNLTVDVPAAIDSLQMGFFPLPRLSHKEPSTSYAVRGKAMRIDLLTPSRKGEVSPVFIRRLNATATPLKYLDYLVEDPISAVMIAGTPCLVKVPQPARYALHKLIISQERDVSSTDKRRNDLLQARNIIALLRDDRPGDLELARESLSKRGASWLKKVEAACEQAGIEL
jgi:hypothetical protein